MNQNYFAGQMKRLADTFGAKHFSNDKLDLIWERVKSFPDEWIQRTVNKFLMSSKFAPLPAEIIEQARIESNFISTAEKENKPFKSVFSAEEITEIMSVVKGIAAGKVSKKDAKAYSDSLVKILKEKGVRND